MNTIELMLEALKDTGARYGLTELAREAIALGEAELKREPVAWIASVPHPWGNDLGQVRQLGYDKPSEDASPLYTREEIK